MTLVEITITINDSLVQPRIDDAWRPDTRARPPRVATLVRDLIQEGSIHDLLAGSFFQPTVTVSVDGEQIQ